MPGTVAGRPSRSRRRDPDSRLTVGLRVSHLLNTVDFEPPGFSPSATLIVRRLQDPMPHQLQPDAWAIRPSLSWERATQEELAEFARRAARPSQGFVPQNASAVLFSDFAELLACLALDLLRGDAPALWWWRAILRSLPSSALDALFAVLHRDARFVPAALALLSSSGFAVPVVIALSTARAKAIFQEVTRLFELMHLYSLFERPSPTDSRLRSFSPSESVSPVDSRSTTSAVFSGGVIRPPWSSLFPASAVPPDLAPEHAALLGVSLMVERSTHSVATSRFSEAFSQWRLVTLQSVSAPVWRAATSLAEPLQATPLASTPLSPSEAVAEIAVAASPSAIAPDSSSDSTIPAPLPTEFVSVQPSANTLTQELLPTARHLVHEPAAAVPASISWEPIPASSTEIPAPLQPAAESSSTNVKLSADLQPAPGQPVSSSASAPSSSSIPALSTPFLGEPLSTGLGGVLFLVNLLKSLDLPRSLESSSGSQFNLSPCELLELIARALLHPRRDLHLASDPVWHALALLDGRAAATLPGKQFTPATHYQIPDSWLTAFPLTAGAELYLRLNRRSRLEIWHPVGFPLLNCTLSPENQSLAVANAIARFSKSSDFIPKISGLRKLHRLRDSCQPLGFSPRTSLRRFLDFLLPYVRMRLAASLGFEPRAPLSLLAKTLLRQPAKIWITKTHVDVLLDLNLASGRVRLSGLDADAGWLAGFGRVFTFHFQKGALR
jgi:hypothetical protein